MGKVENDDKFRGDTNFAFLTRDIIRDLNRLHLTYIVCKDMRIGFFLLRDACEITFIEEKNSPCFSRSY